jgi:lysophospholipase L1-like esterase
MKFQPSLLLSLFVSFAPFVAARADFAIKDGDTVVFLGDSITAAREYGEIIEDYTLLRFPQWKVKFINAGKGGETATQSLARLDKDVFGWGATVVTVAYGINDIGWGFKADEAHKQEYLKAIGEIADRCKKHGVRLFICSAAITSEDPDKAEQGFLQKMCDEGLALAKAKGAGTIDVQRSMREIQRRILAANATKPDNEKQQMHVADGVHLNDLGQMAMAFAMLKGLDAPAEVSAATINAPNGLVAVSENCRISDVQLTKDELTFTRTDERLPFNFGLLWSLNEFYIPFGDELNRHMLTLTGLPSGQYEVTAGGRVLGYWSADVLAHGINIASAKTNAWELGGPWDAQADALKVFTEARNNLAGARHDLEQTLPSSPKLASLQDQTLSIEKKLDVLQHATAQPEPVKFVIRKIETPMAAAPTAATFLPACPLPAGVPTLDDMAGDWKTRTELEQFPSIHNFDAELLVNKDFASVSWLASPPYSQGFHSGVFKLNGQVPVAEKFRWFPYQSVRSGTADSLAIETINRMVFDDHGVLWRITLSNTQPTAVTGKVSIDLIGVISKLTAAGSWDWAFAQPGAGGPKRRYEETETIRSLVDQIPSQRPDNANDYRAYVESTNALVVNDTTTPAATEFAFATKPDSLASDDHQGVATWQFQLAPGETKTIEYVMAYGEGDQVKSNANRWAAQFDGTFVAAKGLWEQRYAEVFTPHNGFFEGNLPVLQTDDPALRRNYYMGVVTMLLMLRDQLPYSPRVFVAGGPRYGASVEFIWDTGMMDTMFAQLEPTAMRAYVIKTLQWDLEQYLAFDYYGNRAFGYRYVANYPMLFRIAANYLRVTGDRAFLDQKLGNETVLQHLDGLALHYRQYLMTDGSGLADFGDNPWHFLECVPTYIHATAGFNAAYVSMLRDMADLYDFLGKHELADQRRAAAEKLVQAIYPQLYVRGKGFWQSRYPDGRQFDMRHCLDFQFVAQSIGDDLPPAVREEMRNFVDRELLMKNWMRAQSLQDPAADKSDRPDHGPMGAYSGWPPETTDGLCHLGDWQDALDFYRRCEAATHEGAFSQGAEFYGPKKRDYDAPVRIANAGTICREAICGADFTDVVIRAFFGFHPSLNLDSRNPLWKANAPRGFNGKLQHVVWANRLYTITSGANGLTVEKE